MRKTNVICSCGFERPHTAEFCPGCGSRVTMRMEIDREMFIDPETEENSPGVVNIKALQSLVESSESELEDDIIPPKRIGLGIGWGASATAILVTIAIAFAVAVDVEDESQLAPSPVISAATDIEKPAELLPRPSLDESALSARIVDGVATIQAGEKPLVTLTQHRESRYETLAERAKSVELRLRHVVRDAGASESSGRFAASRNGEIYEVVWRRGDRNPFRILDVTPRDVRAWKRSHGETNRSILANVIADQLNAALYEEPVPTS